MSSEHVKEIGEEIVREITSRKIPHVDHASLDDFSDTSGRIFVKLKMHKNIGKYWFDSHEKPLRSISNQLHAVCRKMEKEGKASCNSWDVPQPTYDPYGGFDGYNEHYVSFDFDA
jgi:hypothetical protein